MSKQPLFASKNNKRKFIGNISLLLSFISLVTSFGLYLVQRSITLPLQISLSCVVIFFSLYIIIDPRQFRELLTGRQAKYGSNALLLSLSFIGIVVVINFLVYRNTTKLDLTENKEHTLSTESIQILETLPESVTAQAFFTAQTSSDEAKKLLENFKYRSNGKFDYRIIDPNNDLALAKEAKITKDGTIALKMADRQELVTFASEQDIDEALIRLANPGKRNVSFLVGHGELDIDTSSERSLTNAKKVLESKNYTVSTINLLAGDNIAEDTLAIIVAGPQKPLQQEEVDSLKAYLAKKGSLVYLSSPSIVSDFGGEKDLLGDYLKENWEITLTDDIIVDPSGMNSPLMATAASYGEHPITNKLQRIVTIFPQARSIAIPEKASEKLTLVKLVITSDQAWGESDFEGLKSNNLSFDKAKDVLGPLTIAVSGANTDTKSRVVVIGNATFATDQNFTAYGNGDLLINSIDWAAEQENLINLTPKTTTQRFMPPPQAYIMNLILLVTVFLIPAMVVVIGVIVWIQRKRKG